MTNNGQPSYRVIFSVNIAEEIKYLAQKAAAKDLRASFISSLEAIYLRLRRDPFEFGEYRFRSGKVSVFIGAIRPVAVQYAVQADHRLVALQKVVLMDS